MRIKNIFLAFAFVACLSLFAPSCTLNNTADEDALYEVQGIVRLMVHKLPKNGIDRLTVKKFPMNGDFLYFLYNKSFYILEALFFCYINSNKSNY